MMNARLHKQSPIDRQTKWLIAACSGAYCATNVTGWLVPQVMFGIEQRYHVNATVSGMIPTIEALIVGILSMFLGAKPMRVSPRPAVASCLVGLIACNGLALTLPGGILGLALSRAVAAVFTAVILYFSTAVVAATPSPDRSYALLNVANNVFGTVLLIGLPMIYPAASGLGYLAFSAALIGFLLLPLAIGLPGRDISAAQVEKLISIEETPGRGPVNWRATIILVVSIALVSISSFAHYSFAIPLGLQVGLTENAVSYTLGAATIISTVGAGVAFVIVPRFGRFRPMLVALAVMLAANWLTVRAADPLVFRFGVMTNLTAMSFILPLFLGYAAAVDRRGRCGGIVMGAFVTALSIAPFLGGAIYDNFGVAGFLALSMSSSCVAALLTVITDGQVIRRPLPAAP